MNIGTYVVNSLIQFPMNRQKDVLFSQSTRVIELAGPVIETVKFAVGSPYLSYTFALC